MKVFAAASLLLVSLLAGCSSGDEADSSGAFTAAAPTLYLNVTAGNQTYRYTSAVSTGTGSTTGTVTVASTASTSKSGSAAGNSTTGNATKAKGNGTAAASGPVSGEVPLNVTVTLAAKGLPAGKAFTWTLDFGDGAAGGNATGSKTATSSGNSTNSTGTGHAGHTGAKGNATAPGASTGSKLPATVNHTYTSAGNHTLTFTLTPASGSPVHVGAPVQAAAANETGNATPQAGLPLEPEAFHAEGDILLGGTEADCEQLGAVDHVWTIPAEKDGSAVSVKHILVHLVGDDTAVDIDLSVVTPGGETLGNTDGDAGDSDETVDADGPFEPGDYTIHIAACAALLATYTVDGTADLVTA